MEQWFSDPSRVGATVLLMAGIVAFYKVYILPRATHDETVARIVASYKETIAQLIVAHAETVSRVSSDLDRERAENQRLQTMVNRNVDVVDKALNTLEKAQHAFEKSYQFRAELFNPEREKGPEQ